LGADFRPFQSERFRLHSSDDGGVSLAIVREPQSAAAPIDQLHAALVFETIDAAGDGRMFDAESAGRGR
jgi:hypothetical protein